MRAMQTEVFVASRLTRGNLLITFGFTFVAGLLGSIATWIIGAAFLMLTPVLGLLLSNLGSLLVSLLVIPWSAASTTRRFYPPPASVPRIAAGC